MAVRVRLVVEVDDGVMVNLDLTNARAASEGQHKVSEKVACDQIIEGVKGGSKTANLERGTANLATGNRDTDDDERSSRGYSNDFSGERWYIHSKLKLRTFARTYNLTPFPSEMIC